jgi:hypothetical protein
LKIAMNDSRIVRRCQSRGHLSHQGMRLVGTHPSTVFQTTAQCFPPQQIHADENNLFLPASFGLVPEQIKNPADVGMGNLSSQMDFALETRHRVRLHQDFWPDRLDRDMLVQFVVFGAVHLAHAATGNETDYAESPRQQFTLGKSLG